MIQEKNKVTVFDCTIRDGGLMNKWDFPAKLVAKVYTLLSATGIDVIELGYKSSEKCFSRSENGPWKFCSEEDLKTVLPNIKKAEISAMVDIGRIEKEDIKPKEQSSLDWIRVAFYVHQIDEALVLIDECYKKGYKVSANLMSVSQAMHDEQKLDIALNHLAKSPVNVVYIVDSFGNLYPSDISYLVKKYQHHLKNIPIGIHTHNNLQLGFSNTIEAIKEGVQFADATVYGIGRAAGNCPLELLVAYLKRSDQDLKPLLQLLGEDFVPLREKIEWGYLIPYMITGHTGVHPKKALSLRQSDEKDNYIKFYDDTMETFGE